MPGKMAPQQKIERKENNKNDSTERSDEKT